MSLTRVHDPEAMLRSAGEAAAAGDYAAATSQLRTLERLFPFPALQARVQNDLGVLATLRGAPQAARRHFEAALQLADDDAVRANLSLLQADAQYCSGEDSPPQEVPSDRPLRIAIVSSLFHWPSVGGGIVHTAELARELSRAGYVVQLFCPRFPPWGLGGVTEDCPFAPTLIDFDPADWNLPTIQARFREAVGRFDPDRVLITDSWNLKPHLADALRRYPILLRLQGHECLCPLNNVRLLFSDDGRVEQCDRHQLRDPDACRDCLQARAHQSGRLHQAERALAGVETAGYRDLLRRAFHQAAAVLVLNPTIAELVRPWCQRVEVVTWGMDPDRFPPPTDGLPDSASGPTRILFSGIAEEAIKGFRVLHAACAELWKQRQDFELLATSDPPRRIDPFTRFVGWQSQADLPRWYADSAICAVPTIAREGLSRTSVEAMAAGRPVIGSGIGGVPYTVEDGVTGLLCRPGNMADWVKKLGRLLDDDALRHELGRNGRRVFEERFTWQGVIGEQYRPLLASTGSQALQHSFQETIA